MAETNRGRKINKLQAYIKKQHDYRVSVYAAAQLRINKAQAELELYGEAPVELFKPDFTHTEMLEFYSGQKSLID